MLAIEEVEKIMYSVIFDFSDNKYQISNVANTYQTQFHLTNLIIFSTLSLSIAQFIDRSWEFYVRFAVGNEFFGRDLLQGGESYFSPSKTQPPRSATGMYLHSSWLLSGRIDLQPYTILIYCVSSIKSLLYFIVDRRTTCFLGETV